MPEQLEQNELRHGPVCIPLQDSAGEDFQLSRILMRIRGYPFADTLLVPPNSYQTFSNIEELKHLRIRAEYSLSGVICLC